MFCLWKITVSVSNRIFFFASKDSVLLKYSEQFHGGKKNFNLNSFLGVFANLLKAIVSSSCLFVHASPWKNSVTTGPIFITLYIWLYFEDLPKKNQIWLKSGKNNEHFTWTCMYIDDHVSRTLLRMRIVSDRIYTETQNNHFMFNKLFYFRKPCSFRNNVIKHGTVGQATNDNINMTHALCMLHD